MFMPPSPALSIRILSTHLPFRPEYQPNREMGAIFAASVRPQMPGFCSPSRRCKGSCHGNGATNVIAPGKWRTAKELVRFLLVGLLNTAFG